MSGKCFEEPVEIRMLAQSQTRSSGPLSETAALRCQVETRTFPPPPSPGCTANPKCLYTSNPGEPPRPCALTQASGCQTASWHRVWASAPRDQDWVGLSPLWILRTQHSPARSPMWVSRTPAFRGRGGTPETGGAVLGGLSDGLTVVFSRPELLTEGVKEPITESQGTPHEVMG